MQEACQRGPGLQVACQDYQFALFSMGYAVRECSLTGGGGVPGGGYTEVLASCIRRKVV